jgi:hypothetical protein
MNIFVAGIMQGSRKDNYIDDQDYRRFITEAVLERYPGAEVVDPNELHPDGVDYDDVQAKVTLLHMAELARHSDLVVAYVPRASMGTALEMWEGVRGGAKLVTLSPMSANWVVKHLSDIVLPDLAAFRSWVQGGGLDKLLNLD